MKTVELQVNSSSRPHPFPHKDQCTPSGSFRRTLFPELLIVKDPTLRPVAAAMCPRCHGKLWTDFGLSEANLGTVLVCESCGVAYDLIPIFK